MAHLKSLKLAHAEPVRVQSDPVKRARNNVVEALVEQKRLAEARIEGRHYAPTHMVWRKNEVGQRVQVEQPRRIRAGWFENAVGQTCFTLRYAGKPIELAKDKNAVEIGTLDKLPAVIDTLIAAVEAGELDAQLMAAAEERGQMLRKRAG